MSGGGQNDKQLDKQHKGDFKVSVEMVTYKFL